MSKSWESVLKRLTELQERVPEEVVVEFVLDDDSKVRMTVKEILENGEPENLEKWKFHRVVSGNNMKEVSVLLDWLIPDCVIE